MRSQAGCEASGRRKSNRSVAVTLSLLEDAPQGAGVRPWPRAVFGKNLNRLRTPSGWTQDDMAGLAQIDRRSVQRIEAGTANPGIDLLCRLRKALNASWVELLRGVGKPGGG